MDLGFESGPGPYVPLGDLGKSRSHPLKSVQVLGENKAAVTL